MSPRPVCWTCHGAGTIERKYKDKDGKWQSQTVTCPACGGTGEKR